MTRYERSSVYVNWPFFTMLRLTVRELLLIGLIHFGPDLQYAPENGELCNLFPLTT